MANKTQSPRFNHRCKDLTGTIFGRLHVLSFAGSRGHSYHWLCRCQCGNEMVVRTASLRSGATRSCGCLQREFIVNRNSSHGMTGTPEYHAWNDLIQRCTNPRIKYFNYYGGRGITVCERWRHFEAFYADMGPRPSSDHSIDRIDNDGNYEPGNCRWATRSEQRKNQRYLGRRPYHLKKRTAV